LRLNIDFTRFLILGSRDDNDKLSSRVRKFYKKQDELIDSFEQLHNYDARETEAQTNKFNKQKKHIDWLIKATLVFNSVSKKITQYEQINFLLF
jgi:hypothetical protein